MTLVVIAFIVVVAALAPAFGVDTRTPELLAER
jgi:hypothetical protein